jgi:hypothetical protein
LIQHKPNLLIEVEAVQDLAATTDPEMTETEVTETVEEIVPDLALVARRENQEDLLNTAQSEEDQPQEVIQGITKYYI